MLAAVTRSVGVGLVATLCLGALAIGCPAGRSEAQVHFLDVPSPTYVRRYPAVLPDQRTAVVQYIEDRVYRGIGPRPLTEFDRLGSLAIGRDGTMFVVDKSNNQVLMIGQDGSFLGAFGRSGQGPGETERPGLVAVSGDLVWLGAITRRRLLVWSLSTRELVAELSVPDMIGLVSVSQSGLGDGSVLIMHRRFAKRATAGDPNGTQETVFVRLDPAASSRQVYAAIPVPPDTTWRRGGQSASINMLVPTPRQAVSPSYDALYLTPSDRYEVAALRIDGVLEWALVVPWPRQATRAAEKRRVLSAFRRLMPDATESEIVWPAYEPAIERIMTDGDGELHVFPYVSESLGAATRPVDIYDRTGQLLHTAQAPNLLWDAAWQEFVYDVRPSDVTGGYEIVRYRLVKPSVMR